MPELENIEVTGSMMHKAAFAIQGGAGSGDCTVTHWQDALLRYGTCSDRLREAVASLIHLMANSIVLWGSIKALLANRLIALDKCPGVRPIGIGESLRRLISHVVCMASRDDMELMCGSDQLCTGIRVGIEGAIHAVGELYENSESDWGLLLIDATNAFNSINQKALLWNIRYLWPTASRYVLNTYRGWSSLVLGDSSFLFSIERVAQGDSIAMLLYAVATLPLIRLLKDTNKWNQVWYADDSCVDH